MSYLIDQQGKQCCCFCSCHICQAKTFSLQHIEVLDVMVEGTFAVSQTARCILAFVCPSLDVRFTYKNDLSCMPVPWQ